MSTKLVAPFHVNAPSIGHSQSVMYNHVWKGELDVRDQCMVSHALWTWWDNVQLQTNWAEFQPLGINCTQPYFVNLSSFVSQRTRRVIGNKGNPSTNAVVLTSSSFLWPVQESTNIVSLLVRADLSPEFWQPEVLLRCLPHQYFSLRLCWNFRDEPVQYHRFRFWLQFTRTKIRDLSPSSRWLWWSSRYTNSGEVVKPIWFSWACVC